MPDITMCSGINCSAARNCHRSNLSGTVPSDFRQSWFMSPPGHARDCALYWPIRDSSDRDSFDLSRALWRAVEHFARLRHSSIVRQKSPEEMWEYISGTISALCAPDLDYPPFAALSEWIKEGQAGDTPYDQIVNVALAAASCLDFHHGHPTYALKLPELLGDDEVTSSPAQVMLGTGSIQ